MTLTTSHPLKGRKQSAEHIRKRVAAVAAAKAAWTDDRKAKYAATVSAANKNRPVEIVRRFSQSRIGKPHVRKGKKWPEISGANHGMFGKTQTPEAIEKMRLAKLGKKQSAELVAKRMTARAGYRHSDEVKRKIRATNIKTWKRPEIKAKTSGANSPSWQGGKSFEPYPVSWTSELRERIRERDHNCCRACGKPDDENGQRLCIHHVDYDKSNLSSSNLVAVCKSCHGKTNSNRVEWQAYFERTFKQSA